MPQENDTTDTATVNIAERGEAYIMMYRYITNWHNTTLNGMFACETAYMTALSMRSDKVSPFQRRLLIHKQTPLKNHINLYILPSQGFLVNKHHDTCNITGEYAIPYS